MPRDSKAVTYSTDIHNEKHRTHKILYKSENKSSQISVYGMREHIPYCLLDNIF